LFETKVVKKSGGRQQREAGAGGSGSSSRPEAAAGRRQQQAAAVAVPLFVLPPAPSSFFRSPLCFSFCFFCLLPPFFSIFAQLHKLGSTGFDSGCDQYVSMPCVGNMARKYQLSNNKRRV